MNINFLKETLKSISNHNKTIQDIDQFDIALCSFTRRTSYETNICRVSKEDFKRYQNVLDFEYEDSIHRYIVGWISFIDGSWLERIRGDPDYWKYNKLPKLSLDKYN